MQGSLSIEDYVERNISPELNKALKVFSIAVKVWGDGIVDASKRAADVSGVNAETVRRWAAHYYLSLVNVDPSVIDHSGI